MFVGTFEAAVQHAEANGRWLIVNLQEAEHFASHAINRDLWNRF